jgi:hypothetical protein
MDVSSRIRRRATLFFGIVDDSVYVFLFRFVGAAGKGKRGKKNLLLKPIGQRGFCRYV